jgi:hypothetical protein
MPTASNARPVLLVGSVPLASATDVFVAVADVLGEDVGQIPDGETGERSGWIAWQRKRVARTPGLEVGGERVVMDGLIRHEQYRVAPGVDASEIRFGSLGYAEAASESYGEFRRLRMQGRIPAETRFQVSLPTPLAVMFSFVVPAQVRSLWPAYSRRLFEELDEICAAVPHDDLAIQWDLAIEIAGILEVPEVAARYPAEELTAAIGEAAARTPAVARMGLHFCYGDPGHKHLVEPTDMRLMVDLANALNRVIPRTIDWLHMPVPRSRDDEGYFAPLRDFERRPETQIYLGLIHQTDGVSGARRRMAAASRFIDDFGVATECGLGRRPPESVAGLLALHREIARIDRD